MPRDMLAISVAGSHSFKPRGCLELFCSLSRLDSLIVRSCCSHALIPGLFLSSRSAPEAAPVLGQRLSFRSLIPTKTA